MLSIVLVLGIHVIVRIRNCCKRYSTGIQNDNEYIGFGPMKRGETSRILLRFSRCTASLVIFCCINFLHWMKTASVQGGTRANWLRPGALGILPIYHFFSNKVINRWNLLDQQTANAPSINTFNSRLVHIRDNQMALSPGLTGWMICQ